MTLPHRNCIACRVKQCRVVAARRMAALQAHLARATSGRKRPAPAPPTHEPPLPSRRDFLQGVASLGAIGVSRALFPPWMPRLAFRPPGAQASRGPGDVLVVVFLRGGIDGLSAVVPYGEGATYYDRRRTQGVAAPGSTPHAALDLDGFFGLHPALAPLLDVYQARQLAIVHAIGSIDPSRSHFDAMQFMEYGTPGNKSTGTGWLGRHLEAAARENGSPFRAVGLGAMLPSSLRGPVTPLALTSIADFHLRGRTDHLAGAAHTLAQMYETHAPTNPLDDQARLVFETTATLERLSATGYTPDYGAQYPGDSADEGFGLGLKQIAQLIKADVGLEVATIDVGGWDTHEQQGTHGGQFAALLSALARGLAAFTTDLRDHMGNITVVTMSEFGRRVQENASTGTDHGHGNFMMLLGGGVNGGQVVADWPTLHADRLDDGDLAITIDYRDVLSEVLRGRAGAHALDHVFPGFTPTPRGLVSARP